MIVIRVFQITMALFAFVTLSPHFTAPLSDGIWMIALVAWEWFTFNIVRASLDSDGLTYYRFAGSRHISWDTIRSATLWRAAGGVVIRLENRPLLLRYLFLLDSKPNVDRLTTVTQDDPISIVQLRQKLKISRF